MANITEEEIAAKLGIYPGLPIPPSSKLVTMIKELIDEVCGG